jgi:hypothetical protein
MQNGNASSRFFPGAVQRLRARSEKVKDSLFNIRRAFGLVWEAHPASALAMAVCSLVGALLPAGQAWVETDRR